MQIRTMIGSLVGETDDTHWAQTIKTPFAYGVVEVQDEGHGSQLLGMRVLVELTKLFETTLPPLSVVTSKLDAMWEQGLVSIILLIPLGSTIAVIIRGKGTVYVKRDGHISPLLSHEGSVSGTAQTGDIFFLLSKTCSEHIDIPHIIETVTGEHAEDLAETLALGMHGKNHIIGYAGLVIEVRTVEDVDWTKEEKKEDITHWRIGQSAFGQSNNRSSPLHFSLKDGGRKVKSKLRSVQYRLRGINIRIALALTVLFFISIGVGVWREARVKSNTDVIQTLEEARRLIEEGNALLTLNALKSKERFLSAKTLLDGKKQSVSLKTKEGRQMEDLYKQIEENLPRAAQEYLVTPELFFDVSLVKSGAKIDAMALSYDAMVLLDTNTSTLFSLALDSKKGQIIAGGNTLAGSKLVGFHGTTAYVLGNGGIHAVDTKEKTVKASVIPKVDQWQTIESVVAFGGNIYLLDVGKSRVWKYVAVEKKDASASATMGMTVMAKSSIQFSETREYLNPDTLPDLRNVNGMSIDGSVWMGSTNGKVWRFTQGRDDSKEPVGVEPVFGNNIRVYTTDALDFVYVADPDKKRVVVLDKDLVYKAQYRWVNQIPIKDVVVTETLKKILLVSDGKLYSIDLK